MNLNIAYSLWWNFKPTIGWERGWWTYNSTGAFWSHQSYMLDGEELRFMVDLPQPKHAHNHNLLFSRCSSRYITYRSASAVGSFHLETIECTEGIPRPTAAGAQQSKKLASLETCEHSLPSQTYHEIDARYEKAVFQYFFWSKTLWVTTHVN